MGYDQLFKTILEGCFRISSSCSFPKPRPGSSPLGAAKFGGLPDEAKASVGAMSSAELERVFDRVLTAATLDELGLGD